MIVDIFGYSRDALHRMLIGKSFIFAGHCRYLVALLLLERCLLIFAAQNSTNSIGK